MQCGVCVELGVYILRIISNSTLQAPSEAENWDNLGKVMERIQYLFTVASLEYHVEVLKGIV